MNRIKDLRLREKKTQKEVADYLGITSACFSYYEAGRRGMSLDIIAKLCSYFNVSADCLLGFSDYEPLKAKERIAVFAGTFDPFTLGHKKTVEEAVKIFDTVVVAIMINKAKKPMFTPAERERIIKLSLDGEKKVRVMFWDGIAVDLLKKLGTPFYIRGLRNSADFEYETADYYANKNFFDSLIEIYLPCEQQYLHISSSMVKNSLLFDKPIDGFVPSEAESYITECFKKRC